MNEILEQKINDFLETTTGEAIIADCEQFGIELEDTEEYEGVSKALKRKRPKFFRTSVFLVHSKKCILELLMNTTKIAFKDYNQGLLNLFPSRLDENISDHSLVCAYSIVSTIISILVYLGNGTFFASFLNNLIPLLATLFAIYLTANTLVAIEINRIKDKHPEADTLPTTNEIKRIFFVQLVLILILILVFVIRDFLQNIESACMYRDIIIVVISNAFAISVFGYFLEAIYDTGKTLFVLIDFNSKNINK